MTARPTPTPTTFGADGHTNGSGRLLTADDVAELLAVARTWVYAEARAGRLPHVRVGRYVRFRRSAIDAWVGANERGSGPQPEGFPHG